jgi:putative heme-binding domain-containing protein
LRAFHIKPKGAGYELTQENLVTSTDNWFRLSDVCVAPDGSVMIADWYDPGVGGHGMGDWKMGRIYRVTPKGHKGYRVPEVKMEDAESILQVLEAPCLAARWLATDRIQNQIERKMMDHVHSLAHQTKRFPLMGRSHYAIWPRIIRGAKDQEERDQLSATTYGLDVETKVFQEDWDRLMPTLLRINRDIIRRPLGRLKYMDAEANNKEEIAREFALSLRDQAADPVKSERFFELAKLYDGQDHFYRAALNIACGTDPKRREAILADFDKQFPDWNDKVADLVWELRPASSIARVGKLLDDTKLTAAQKGRLVDILAVHDDPNAGKTMLSILGRDASPEMKSRAVENLATFLPNKWKELQKGDEVREVISKYLRSKDDKLAGLRLAAAAPDCTQQGELEDLATDANENRDIRTRAVQIIGKVHHVKYFHTLEKMVDDKVIGTTAVMAIGDFVSEQGDNSGAKQARALLQKLIVDPKTSDELRKAALNSLVATRQGSGILLQLKEKNEMPDSIVADAGKLLRNSPFQGERNKAMLLFPAAAKVDLKKLPPPTVLAQRVGNAARGEALFKATAKNDAQCARCHTVRGVGGNIGPDLSMIGKKGSKENLYDSLLTPSKAIADQYLQWKVNTLDEKSVTGLLVEESATSLTLRDANGKDHTFAVKDLDGGKQKSLVSIMPDNLVATLTEEELVDMVEYMMTLKTASLSPDYWYVMGPFIRNGDQPLKHEHGPEKAKFDPKATFPEWNGPSSGRAPKDLAWRTIRPDAKGYVDLMAFHGDAGANSLSYLYRAIESTIEQDAEILIGSDDGCVVWVNGKEVLRENVTRAAAPEQNRVKVKLQKGKNDVLIKIANGNNPHGMYFALTSAEELKLVK